MEIQLPSVAAAQHHYLQISDCLLEFNNYFRNSDFDDRYGQQFEWFRKRLRRTEKVLNLGSGSGLETFALMWALKAHKAVGIDVKREKIDHAKKRAQDIWEFSTEVMPSIFAETQNVRQLREWYEAEVPFEIRKCILPEFFTEDISKNISKPEDEFDLVYCRYVLWIIANGNGASLHATCRNIASIVRPEVGRVVIVEPTKKDTVDYDFESCFRNAGLILDWVEEEISNLGWLEEPETNPKGYIFKPNV